MTVNSETSEMHHRYAGWWVLRDNSNTVQIYYILWSTNFRSKLWWMVLPLVIIDLSWSSFSNVRS